MTDDRLDKLLHDLWFAPTHEERRDILRRELFKQDLQRAVDARQVRSGIDDPWAADKPQGRYQGEITGRRGPSNPRPRDAAWIMAAIQVGQETNFSKLETRAVQLEMAIRAGEQGEIYNL